MHAISVKPADMTVAARDEFIAFVIQAGEVNAATLPDLVDRAVAIVIMREGASLVGTAAVKTPNVTYPPKVFRKAKVEGQAPAYPFELGWVHVHHAYERQGRGHALVAAAIHAAAGKGLYATTKSEAMRRMLPKLGFTALGTPYVSAEDPSAELTLFVRSSR
ncbi:MULTISPECIES: GNAT family N-acetyltransferase [Alphaproteobacteria]|jgi:GNAT superfamily N-acetyltransferase|uniref:N-acetyltransferase domain-containing protein n=3 Tax=Alphaproteobacteria TaxID=28211 RepID=A0A2D0AMA7_9SPHN|nr:MULTISPECIES: GNAT family N-acetyltransferase [Alphaproteobacteria]PZR82037.1 MAG: GNAT family N-acetyltransferase [Stutzerimonas stutzeri]MDX3885206.1 GNAT family N-acetyltransferase [Sphingomonas sp.]ODP39603.1 hypothetical protein BFL28_09680 [Sphingomonas turrisvirgatae]OWQ88652.1 hypothetical protein CDQ91_20740 [Sphingopyxis witflariensis]SPU54838.1 Uncharacterised protein [Brevundimonas vesicularis]